MAFASDSLTINVSFCDITPSQVRMTGPWWGWDANAGPVADANGDGTWTFKMAVPLDQNPPYEPVDMEYKIVADGSNWEDLTDEPCIENQGGFFNRFWRASEYMLVSDITFGQCAACTTTGTETDLLSGLSIYPNPATDVLMVSNDNNIDRVQMINIFGSVVLDQTIQANSGKLDVSAMSPGIYFVTVSANSQQVVRKITVK